MTELQEIFQEIDEAVSDKPNRIKGVEAVYQFNVNGDDSGTYHIVFNGEKSYAAKGEAEKADCTITMSTDDFKKMVDGNLNGTKAFMSGRLKIKGNMALALKLQDILSSYRLAK
ncbi:SCP2 sterol-binding domain-containing protein [Aquibacillus sp. 3ASR75-11]|uniref:SCP2 sterol-binding domain-containing protein n=1 Tax=Terrihalobacillus insolitus TaxID=2950438 RepID=A0A9X3WX12_9BACI|nr:SCP2 sterol-binding domain-containing protein [Terrihalobacillus insolitus]MDC3414562.1 SCP2 sterol-binding domain-containing protein [Terrihalobacillus insolitus]MDC3425761.1 SCP2 sterol-binding domain-containing protein [Terrihalobacillus insolitus]